MRVLFTTSPVHGHLFPLVPLAHALRAAGDDVLVAAPANFTGAITEAALPAGPTAPSVDFLTIMTRERDGRPVPPATNAAERNEGTGRAWGRLTAATLPYTLELVERWRPDVIISEPTEHAGQLAAETHGLPWVEHGWGVTTMPEARPPARDELTPELAGLGLTDLPEPMLRLHPCPPSLRPADPPGSRDRHIRYVPYSGAAALPEWILRRTERPRVTLAVGSSLVRAAFRNLAETLAEVAAVLHGLGIEVVAGLEDPISPGWTLPLPAGAPTGLLPLHLVAPTSDLVVHHGRSGATLTAVTAGLPQLALPRFADQFDNAARISAAGAGRQLLGEGVTAESVVAACRDLLDTPSYRDRAAALSAENAAQPTPTDVVAVIHDLTAALV
ncbi:MULTISPECIES: glycosyltransferase [unclassified Frankia]|uniref:glycosyltransferase n=1 Tax=unclassified Frankia TaxID=2632575 RepID=UPI002025853D